MLRKAPKLTQLDPGAQSQNHILKPPPPPHTPLCRSLGIFVCEICRAILLRAVLVVLTLELRMAGNENKNMSEEGNSNERIRLKGCWLSKNKASKND